MEFPLKIRLKKRKVPNLVLLPRTVMNNKKTPKIVRGKDDSSRRKETRVEKSRTDHSKKRKNVEKDQSKQDSSSSRKERGADKSRTDHSTKRKNEEKDQSNKDNSPSRK